MHSPKEPTPTPTSLLDDPIRNSSTPLDAPLPMFPPSFPAKPPQIVALRNKTHFSQATNGSLNRIANLISS